MNLIQIKQIDGLQTALNNIASDQYQLSASVSGSFGEYDDFWYQANWTREQINFTSAGSSFEGKNGLAIVINNGGLFVRNDITCEGDLSVADNIVCQGGLSTSNDVVCGGSLSVGGSVSGVGGVLSISDDVACQGDLSVSNDVACQGDLSVSNDISCQGSSSLNLVTYTDGKGDTKTLKGSIFPNYESVLSSAFDLGEDSYIVGVQTSTIGSSSIIKLPTGNHKVAGKEVFIKDEQFNASSFNIEVNCSDGLIDGSSQNFVITGDGGYLNLYTNGTNWFSLGQA